MKDLSDAYRFLAREREKIEEILDPERKKEFKLMRKELEEKDRGYRIKDQNIVHANKELIQHWWMRLEQSGEYIPPSALEQELIFLPEEIQELSKSQKIIYSILKIHKKLSSEQIKQKFQEQKESGFSDDSYERLKFTNIHTLLLDMTEKGIISRRAYNLIEKPGRPKFYYQLKKEF